jgi:ATP-dependent Clp protease ATP-binding subunit ClpB
VVGQDEALTVVANAVRRGRAGLQEESRPIGSFLFLGTTGVGKTELAKALAAFLFNDEEAMVRIDMSEYQERHTVARLIGAPPGYVGYEEGGQLTEKVRRRPYSVVLLDEIEKAHPEVFNVLLQVLDDGRLTDSQGRTVDFTNTLVVMTSNLGSDVIRDRLSAFDDDVPDEAYDRLEHDILALLKQRLRPEFLNRIDEVVMFRPLGREQTRGIVRIQFERLQRLARKQHSVTLELTEEAVDYLTEKGFDPVFGARPLKRVLQREVANKLAEEILSGWVQEGETLRIDTAADGAGLVFEHAEAAEAA